MGEAKIRSIEEARKQRDRDHYRSLVMKAWDDAEHRERRTFRERKAEVERKGRERL